MNKSKVLAKRFKEVTLNGIWIANTNFKDQLANLSILEANTKINNLNTICLLAQHINYYIEGILNVFNGGDLEIKDKFSFDFEPIQTEKDWANFKLTFENNAIEFAKHIENLSDDKLNEDFMKAEYDIYERNIDGMIEHCYYHLGQVSLIRKMISL